MNATIGAIEGKTETWNENVTNSDFLDNRGTPTRKWMPQREPYVSGCDAGEDLNKEAREDENRRNSQPAANAVRDRFRVPPKTGRSGRYSDVETAVRSAPVIVAVLAGVTQQTGVRSAAQAGIWRVLECTVLVGESGPSLKEALRD